MTPVTLEDRRNELHSLLDQIRSQPSRDWTGARKRVLVLQEMIAAAERSAEQEQAGA